MKTEEILERIEELENYEIEDFIPSLYLTPEQMKLLADHENEYVRYELAKNPNLTNDAMIKLGSDEDEDIKYQLAKNPNLTNAAMIKLGSDEDWYIRGGLARNPNLTDELMIKLSNDENVEVRKILALNPKITEKVMVKLSNAENKYVREGLALNPNLTEKLMIKLSSDEKSVYVRYEAFKKLEKLNSLSSDDLESAYDLINNSKYIGKKNFEKTFDFIINNFPELSELAKMFKRIILKGKKDLK